MSPLVYLTEAGQLDFVCDHDGKETYCRITVPVPEENVSGVRRQVLNDQEVTIYLRREKGKLPTLFRLWAQALEEAEDLTT